MNNRKERKKMANNNINLTNVFGVIDKALEEKDREIFLLKYELEDLKKKLKAAEDAKKGEVA